MRILYLLLTVAVATAIPLVDDIQPRAIESDDTDFRLSGVIIPESYSIELDLPPTIFEGGTNTTFYGNATILFRVTGPTSTIDIHANFFIEDANLNSDTDTIAIDITQPNITTKIATFTLTSPLEKDVNYTLTINYVGTVEPIYMRGLYRSSYKGVDGIPRYLVTTQFQPDYARNVFPCFDEPQYKARFSLAINHPNEYVALFNSKSVLNETVSETTTRSTFEESPLMSTYLVAFAVSDFTCTEGESIAPDVQHRVCSKINSDSDRALANQWSAPIMQALETKTGILYNETHNKMDQLAIPDFSAGAMENWGLVTYREPYLLYNPTESSNVDKQNVISIIAHEFAHMWFGNLVTTTWWNNLFLNEGFASYFEYFAPAMLQQFEVTEVWELTKQFIVDQVQNALAADASSSSQALSAQASTSAEIWAKFSTISYHKGAAVLRMVEHFLGANNFEAGIRNYLRTNFENNTEPTNLWSSLQQFVEGGRLPQGLTLEQVMNNWIDLPGYPVIMVNSSGNDVIINQKRFRYQGSDSNTWFVPISYTTSANLSHFEDTAAKEWLYPGNSILRIPDVIANNSWIIVNNQESSFYRVNYDTDLWSRIRTALTTNHNAIDVLNRAQIVDDVFNLARSGDLRYSEAIEILRYLTRETEYYPLYSAATNFDVLLRLVGENSNLGRELNSLQLEFLNGAAANVTFDSLNEANQIETLKLRLILGRLCKLGQQTCVSRVLELFESLRNGTNVNRNLRSVVYCNGLRHSEDPTRDWEFLWSRFGATTLSTEKVTILNALGCTTNIMLLNQYLNLAINDTSGIRPQDLSRVWSSVVTSNPEGLDVAFEFYVQNIERMRTYFSSSVSLISTIASRFNTQEQFDKLQNLSVNAVDQSVRDVASASLNLVTDNQNWLTVNSPQLEEYFRTPVDGGAFRNIGTTIAVFICSLIVIFM